MQSKEFHSEPNMNQLLLTFITGAAVIALAGSSVFGEEKIDPRFMWPKNSLFVCRGVVAQEEGTFRLKPDQDMLTWCDAEVGGKDEVRVLRSCKLGERCEIRGMISGHGTFGWAKITSIKALPQAERQTELRNVVGD
jgi:hypothetical protein